MTPHRTGTPAGQPDAIEAEAGRASSTGAVSALGVLRSEWVKFRSVRSHLLILSAAVLAVVVVGTLFSGFVSGVLHDPGEAKDFVGDPTGASLQGTDVAQLIVGILGVVLMTGEYATGTIRTTLTMVPRRLPVLMAKVVVTAAVTFATMLLTAFLVFLSGQWIIGHGPVPPATLSDPGVLRAVIGTAGYLTGVALLGLALGALLRSGTGSVTILVVLLFALPGLAELLLPARSTPLLRYLPSNAGQAFTHAHASPDLLSPTTGLLTFLGWVIVPLLGAAVALRRRPA